MPSSKVSFLFFGLDTDNIEIKITCHTCLIKVRSATIWNNGYLLQYEN